MRASRRSMPCPASCSARCARLPSRVRPERISLPMTSIAAVGLGMARPRFTGGRPRGIPGRMRFGSPLVRGPPGAAATSASSPTWCWTAAGPGDRALPQPRRMLGLAEPGMRRLAGARPAGAAKALPGLAPSRAAGRPSGRHRHGGAEPAGGRGAGARAIPALAGYTDVRPEQRYGRASRVDFLPTEPGLPAGLRRGQERAPQARGRLGRIPRLRHRPRRPASRRAGAVVAAGNAR